MVALYLAWMKSKIQRRTAMTHDEMIAVIQAHKEGKAIQFKRHLRDKWEDVDSDPSWNFPEVDYRIKPSPMEIWGNFVEDKFISAYFSYEKAIYHANEIMRTVKLREVVDEN